MLFSIYPWNLSAWRIAFRTAGLPGFALLALLLGAMLQAQDVTGAGGGAGHASLTSILLVRLPLTLVALLLLLFHPHIARISIHDTRFLFVSFGALYLTSTLWSVQPVVTLGKAVEIILICLVFLEASRSTDPLTRVDALRQIILLTISLVALFTVTGFILRISAFVQQRPGIFTATTAQSPFLSGNGLGYVASALFLVVLAEWQAGRIRRQSAFLQMSFALAIFSVAASRTSLVILLLSVLVIVYRRSRIAATLCSGVVVLLIGVFREAILTRLQGQQSEGNFETLSSRTILWTAALRQWHEHPLFGSGGGVGGKLVIQNLGDAALDQASSLHSGFMELLVGLGAVGLIIGVCLLVLATWKAWRAWRRHPEYSATYVLIIHAWLTTIMSTGVLGWMGYEMALFLCILTNLDLLQDHRVVASRTPYRASRESPLTVALR